MVRACTKHAKTTEVSRLWTDGVLVTTTTRAQKTLFPTRFMKKWQINVNFPGVDFLGTAPKCTKRKKHSSFCVKVPQETSREKISRLGRAGMARKMYQKASCTSKIVIFLINKPIAPLTFLFPSSSPSALLKLPYIVSRSLSFFPLPNTGIVHNLS